jgi:hypothetical protein
MFSQRFLIFPIQRELVYGCIELPDDDIGRRCRESASGIVFAKQRDHSGIEFSTVIRAANRGKGKFKGVCNETFLAYLVGYRRNRVDICHGQRTAKLESADRGRFLPVHHVAGWYSTGRL